MSQQVTSNMQQELNDMDWHIAQARKELQAARAQRIQGYADHSRQIQALETERYEAKSILEKHLSQLGLSAYKHAVLDTQTSAVQPYILQKLAVLCHALHHTEVVAKQIQMMQQSTEELEIILRNSMDQIEDFWEPRLLHLTESVCWSKRQVYDMASRLPNGEAYLRTFSEEHKENDEPSPQNTMLVSVLSMVMAAGRFHQVPSQNKAGRRHSLTFLPFSQTKKPVETACGGGTAMASFNSAQHRRLSA